MEKKPLKGNEKLKQLLSKLKVEVDLLFQQLLGQSGLEWAIAGGMGFIILFTVMYNAWEAHSGFGLWVDLLAGFAGGMIGFGLSLLISMILIRLIRWVFRKTPPLVIASVALAAAVQVWWWGDNYWVNLGLVGAVLLTVLCLSAGVHLLNKHRQEGAGILKWLLTSFVLVLGMAGAVFLGWLFLAPGEKAISLPGEHLSSGFPDVPNPAEAGPYQVRRLNYGSGSDRHRPEYAAEVDLITDSVNASPYIYFSGWQEDIREWYWGFGMSDVPLNARVWYPIGEGPFPLVLVVHGNHAMTDFSETGYAYLGELLASRGFIVASVDENFFNGSLYGKARSETDARAWLLLKHLEEWERWNSQPGTVFYQKVDLDHIALIGHSRGGEAVGLAATFNRLRYYPENGKIIWDFNFSIQSVVAIAPVDQQYKPAGHPAEIKDINYLVLQGSHDGDVSSFKGIQQYERVSFSIPRNKYFKAAVYIYRANHGQFNLLWGDQDRSGKLGALLNKAAFLDEADQRQIAEVYISAFLEATLNQQEEYLPLFQDYRFAGNWLPATNYLTQYQDSGSLFAADFEEDADLTTAALPGSSTQAYGVLSWKERALRFRNNDLKENHVVQVGWTGSSGYYGITLPDGITREWGLDSQDFLVFLAADEQDPFTAIEPIDFSILLIDGYGQTARVRLSDIITISPQLPTRFTKIDIWDKEIFENNSEVVMQSVRVPLVMFTAENPDLALGSIKEIRFVFDQTPAGTVSLDEIGFDLED